MENLDPQPYLHSFNFTDFTKEKQSPLDFDFFLENDRVNLVCLFIIFGFFINFYKEGLNLF